MSREELGRAIGDGARGCDGQARTDSAGKGQTRRMGNGYPDAIHYGLLGRAAARAVTSGMGSRVQ